MQIAEISSYRRMIARRKWEELRWSHLKCFNKRIKTKKTTKVL